MTTIFPESLISKKVEIGTTNGSGWCGKFLTETEYFICLKEVYIREENKTGKLRETNIGNIWVNKEEIEYVLELE